MSIIISRIKNFVDYLKNSLKQIFLGFSLVLLSMSGFITAATVSSLFNFNGILISFIGIIVEIFGIGFSYWLFTTFFQATEEEISEKRSKK